MLEYLRKFQPDLITYQRHFNADLQESFILPKISFSINISCPSGWIIAVKLH